MSLQTRLKRKSFQRMKCKSYMPETDISFKHIICLCWENDPHLNKCCGQLCIKNSVFILLNDSQCRETGTRVESSGSSSANRMWNVLRYLDKNYSFQVDECLETCTDYKRWNFICDPNSMVCGTPNWMEFIFCTDCTFIAHS